MEQAEMLPKEMGQFQLYRTHMDTSTTNMSSSPQTSTSGNLTSLPQKSTSGSLTSSPQKSTSGSLTSSPQKSTSGSLTSSAKKSTSGSLTSSPQKSTRGSLTSSPKKSTSKNRASSPQRSTRKGRTSSPQRSTRKGRTSSPQRSTSKTRNSSPQRSTSKTRNSSPQRSTSKTRNSSPQRSTSKTRNSSSQRNTRKGRTHSSQRSTSKTRTSSPKKSTSKSWTSSSHRSNRDSQRKSSPFSTSNLNQSLDELLAGVLVPEKDILKPKLNRSILSGIPTIPVALDVSDGETSMSDSGSDSPVCVELPQQPTVYQHTISNVRAELSWTGPSNDELVSFYELRLQEARLTARHKSIKWFCSRTEEHLENLTPGTEYLFRVRALNVAGAGKWSEPYKFSTMPAVPGLALDPSPVIAIVRRHRKPQRKTIFLPAS